uniref:Uncharacterized protein n=1 Tax=Glossina austeni TaxID=7395 RepID=A0A1A9UP37_GLOAU
MYTYCKPNFGYQNSQRLQLQKIKPSSGNDTARYEYNFEEVFIYQQLVLVTVPCLNGEKVCGEIKQNHIYIIKETKANLQMNIQTNAPTDDAFIYQTTAKLKFI